MAKKACIALRLHSGEVSLTDYRGEVLRTNLRLPDGCIGVCFAFESKAAAKRYWDKLGVKTELIEIKKEENK